MQHQLKIKKCYLIHILEERKTFEVRKNDRDFQSGDTIKFLPLDDEEYDLYGICPSPIPAFVITYVLEDVDGLSSGYAVLSIEQQDQEENES